MPPRCRLGGSVAFCDPTADLAMAVAVNRLSLDRDVADRLVDAVYTSLGLGKLAFL